MDIETAATDPFRMPAKPKKPPVKLHWGEWIARLDKKPVEVAKAVGITESYLSLLISGERANPSIGLVIAITDFLGITVNDLKHRPPPPEAIRAAGELPPDQLAALARLLEGMKPRRGS